MVLTDFLTETRRRWLKAFKLFKKNNTRKCLNRNRISPELVRSPSYSGTVDARSEIDVQRFCACRVSLPPLHDSDSFYSSVNSDSCHDSLYSSDAIRSNDSAYVSARNSPVRNNVCYATVTYFNVNDSEDSSSIRTEYTILEYDENSLGGDERQQNMINESLELVSSL